jgi:sugar O-acyltransferase (sialic acid O-acetyltransferase NeuD family)
LRKLIIFGTGDIAQLAHYYFSLDNKFEVVAFTVDREYISDNSFCNLPVVPFDEIEKQFSPGEHNMFVALSYSKLNRTRAEKFNAAKSKGYKLVSYVSPKATLYDNVRIGDNCFIFEDNTIQPFVTIGNNVTLWSGNHIGHHSTIRDHCFIASHAVISGGVTIDPYCFIGVNATIRDHVHIAEDCIIGAGALITQDTIANSVYKGIPSQTADFPARDLKKI